jgi:beta-galactosidase
MIQMSMAAFVASLALLLSSPAVSAHPNDVPAVLLGVAWYPEQWPPERWDQDLALMEAAGIRMVRIGEFAWSSMEPQEGRYELDWVERAIAKAAAHHIFVVLGTPTDAPPAWLTGKYPETLRVDETGEASRTWGAPAVLLHQPQVPRIIARDR